MKKPEDEIGFATRSRDIVSGYVSSNFLAEMKL